MKLKGTYSSGTSYSVGDVVVCENHVYILQNPAVAGTHPTNTLYWGQLDAAEVVNLIMDGVDIAEAGALVDKVANNLTTTTSGYVLDARQGKALKTLVDACLTAGDITDALDSTATNKALSAKQGGVLNGKILSVNPDGKTLRLQSSTASSEKIFDITVNDSGELTATEYTPAEAET